MPHDITAILVPLPPRGLTPNDIVNAVAQNAPPATWVRLAPLEKLEIHQLEVLDGNSGLPAVAPAMLIALSQNRGKAMFIHVNHQAKQAMLHAFEDGIEVASYNGEPTEQFTSQFQELVGHSVDDLVAADDGTRVGFGQAASRTAALVRGRLLLVPAGTPTGLGTFGFHDRGYDRPSELQITDADDAESETTRVAFFAFDGELISRAWGELPGTQLTQVIGSAQVDVLGPLIELREETAQHLASLETSPGQSKSHPAWHTHAFEMLALCHAGVFAGGDTAAYIDQKVLSLLHIGDATPIIDADEAEELEQLPSVLDMMVEVLPCPKPPGGYGPLLEQVGGEELGALVPWAKPGEPYDGAVFLVKPERLINLARSFDGQKLGTRLERFCRALYTARHGATDPSNKEKEAAYLAWRGELEERSREDIERFLTAWAELRVVFEMAVVNRLHIGLIVYG